MNNVALITGASSGIGLELAHIHARRGGDLVLVARREDKLKELAEELSSKHGVETLVIAKDLTEPQAAAELFEHTQARGIVVEMLVNNAGFGGHGRFHERAWERDENMIQLNVTALAALTRLFLPGMIERGGGRILNVGSMAGFLPGPFMAVYYATKAFVLSFSEAIASELKGTGVTVTVLCPGATRTEFADAADLRGSGLFKTSVSASGVAAYGYRAAMQGKTVAVPGFLNNVLVRWLVPSGPRFLNTRISRSMLEKPEG